MEEPDVRMKQLFLLPNTVDHPADGSDHRPEGAGEDRRDPLIRIFDGGIVKTPEQGEDEKDDGGLEV
jgi:hypothetical protein